MSQDENEQRHRRLTTSIEGLKALTAIEQKAATEYGELVGKLRSDRRDMLKYLGTVASGAAALAPQLFDHVRQTAYFYSGEIAFILCAAVAITYLISTTETDADDLSAAYRKTRTELDELQQIRRTFIEGDDHSSATFLAHNQQLLDAIRARERQDEEPNNEGKFYQKHDYSTEYLLLFFIAGVMFTVLSVTTLRVGLGYIVLTLFSAFTLINVLTTWPIGTFVVLGAPIDIIKGVGRSLGKFFH